jgi:hypothetical protein
VWVGARGVEGVTKENNDHAHSTHGRESPGHIGVSLAIDVTLNPHTRYQYQLLRSARLTRVTAPGDALPLGGGACMVVFSLSLPELPFSEHLFVNDFYMCECVLPFPFTHSS